MTEIRARYLRCHDLKSTWLRQAINFHWSVFRYSFINGPDKHQTVLICDVNCAKAPICRRFPLALPSADRIQQKFFSQQNSVWFYAHRSHNTTKQKFKQNHSPVNVEIRGNFYSRRLIDLPNQKNNTCYFGQCGLIMQKMLGMLGTFCRNCAWMMPCHLTFNFIVLKIFASNKMKKLKNTYRRA